MRPEPRPERPPPPEPAAQQSSGHTSSSESSSEDIKDRILAIPGMSLIEEKPSPSSQLRSSRGDPTPGYRFFVLEYTQPIDHKHPSKGTFQQRITLLHKDTTRPTVFFTGGYNVSTTPSRSEPTQIIDGNQVSWSTGTSPRPARNPPTGRSSTSGRPPATSTGSSRR